MKIGTSELNEETDTIRGPKRSMIDPVERQQIYSRKRWPHIPMIGEIILGSVKTKKHMPISKDSHLKFWITNTGTV